MQLNHKDGEIPVSKVILVGYGREQMRQFKCQNCSATYFNQDESDIRGCILCEDCISKSGYVDVESDTERYFSIIGWQQRVDTFKKRSNFNYIKVAKRDNYTCQYCGYSPRLFVDFKPMHVDHIRPFSAGGNNSMKNLVMACADCNMHLSNKIFSDFHNKKVYIIDWRKKKKKPFTHDQWVEFGKRTTQNFINNQGENDELD